MSEVRKHIGEYSIKELRVLCQGSAPDPARESKVGLFTRIFSIYATKALLHTNIHPNMITIVSVVLFFLGIGTFYFEDIALQLVGVFLIFLSIVVDGCDGEVARFTGKGSPVGSLYVEPVSHDIQYGLSYLLLGIFLVLQGHSFWFVVVGALASISKLLYRLLEMRLWVLKGLHSSEEDIKQVKEGYAKKPMSIRMVYWINKNFLSSTSVLPVLLIAALTMRLDIILALWAVGYILFWLALFAKQILWILNTYYK